MVRIDETRCIGCGICVNMCPEGIEIVGGKARIKNKNAECLKDAANACPRGAILLVDKSEQSEESRTTEFGQGFGRGRGFGSGMGRGQGGGRRKW